MCVCKGGVEGGGRRECGEGEKSNKKIYVIGSRKQPLLCTDILLNSGGLQRIT